MVTDQIFGLDFQPLSLRHKNQYDWKYLPVTAKLSD
jgi:hypothetical protein